jgi:hypothetical protein
VGVKENPATPMDERSIPAEVHAFGSHPSHRCFLTITDITILFFLTNAPKTVEE